MSGSDALPRFDERARIGPGITVLEASAGTGKTHAVASIVVNEVANGLPIHRILAVTFTIKATGTLRARVWERLRHAASDPERPADQRARLETALTEFDRATIETIHGFCHRVLAELGVAGDGHRELELVEDVRQLIDDAVDDLFIRRFHGGDTMLFSREEAAKIAKVVIDNPTAEIGPYDSASPTAKLRTQFALAVRRRVEAQKRARRILTFDDLLTRLATSVDDSDRGDLAVERLRSRFSLAIVDEFQDTDATQWQIFERAFGSGDCRLVLVGDPKQAIYAFRGGDVQAYLAATEKATTTLGLDVSWRADGVLLEALNALFDGARLGDERVRHRPVEARPGAEAPRLVGPNAGAPLTFRLVDREVHGLPGRSGAKKTDVREVIATDVATVVVGLLDGDLELTERDEDGREKEGARRPVHPGDIAVLVRTNRDAERIRDALFDAGVPAVVHGTASVLTTPAAQQWLELLLALDRPALQARVRQVALGPFVGWSAEQLATADDAAWDRVEELVHEWSTALRRHGVAGLLRRIEAGTGLTARVLGTVGGERLLSDLRHVAELLHTEHGARPGSAGALARWFADRIAEARASDEGRRRLESDADAVTLQTIHGAKGLEFPIVLLPCLHEAPWVPDDELPVFHDDDGNRWIGVGGVGTLHEEHKARARAEREGEDLRLAYVALTRAAQKVVVWWCTTRDARSSPLGRLLLARGPDGEVRPDVGHTPEEAEVRAAVSALTLATDGKVVLEEVPPGARPSWSPGTREPPALALARWNRTLDATWRRTSYSALTAAAHDAGTAPAVGPGEPLVALERVDVDERVTVDEPVGDEDAGPAAGAGAGGEQDAAEPVPLSDLPTGARFGTLVHTVLEHTDFAADDLRTALAVAAAEAGADRHAPGRVPALVDGLLVALGTPLGPLLDGRPLRGVARTDRLDELDFDLPLAGGDEPKGDAAVTMAAVADVFERRLPADDPLAGYHERLRDEILGTRVRGFLNGSIDLVVRSGDRYVVVDYKTNHLGTPGEPLTAHHYRPEALADAMVAADYPLQAALYAVALHRYLSWRLPGYDPERHLGGVGYLFLRGMTGEPGAGVFAWHPPAGFVLALSELLETGVTP